MIARLQTQAIDVYNDAHQYRGEDSLTHDPEIPQVRNKSYRDEVTSQATEEEEDLEADTAKHSSVLETAVSRSTLDGEVSSRDRISKYTIEQTLDVPMPEMVKQLVEVPKTISQNRNPTADYEADR